MAAVVQFYDANGNLSLDLSRRVFRVLKTVTTGTADGSVLVPGLSQGTMIVSAGDAQGYKPSFSQSGDTVSWTFNGVPTSQRVSVPAVIAVY